MMLVMKSDRQNSASLISAVSNAAATDACEGHADHSNEFNGDHCL
jgi:hypothetical protein